MSIFTTSERGFKQYSNIESSYGGYLRVYESSAASGPHVWVESVCPMDLNDPEGAQKETHLHVPLAEIERLRDQLNHILKNHYQTEDEDEEEDCG